MGYRCRYMIYTYTFMWPIDSIVAYNSTAIFFFFAWGRMSIYIYNIYIYTHECTECRIQTRLSLATKYNTNIAVTTPLWFQ